MIRTRARRGQEHAVASTSGNGDGEHKRRGRTAAEQRAEQEVAASPEALAKEIEQTRADLAVTLDAIADKVSPKRVAKRTTQQAAETMKEGAAAAKEALISGAASAKEVVVAGAETVKGKMTGATGETDADSASRTLADTADTADTATDTAADTATDTATGMATDTTTPVVRGGPLVEPSAGLDAAMPPVTAVPVPELGAARSGAATTSALRRTPTPSRQPAPAGGGALGKEYIAAGAAILAMALLLWRNSRK